MADKKRMRSDKILHRYRCIGWEIAEFPRTVCNTSRGANHGP